MPLRKSKNLSDVYEQKLKQRIMERMEERLSQLVDHLTDQVNNLMNNRRPRNRRREDEDVEPEENVTPLEGAWTEHVSGGVT
ncbi:hypothetical protein Tco_0354869 [Tanacetum coccineum]